MNDKYTAMEVANYIIWFVNKQKIGEITPLKLQKLLYYVAAYYFQENKSRLFEEGIEKWKYGPVVPSVYHSFKFQGIEHINAPVVILEEDESSILGYKRKPFNEEKFTLNDSLTNLINMVVNSLVKKNAFELVEITHKEKAWRDLESKILQGVHSLFYSDSDLRDANFQG